MLNVKNLSVSISNKRIVEGVSFELNEHDILMVIGPNGAGKTTLIRALMGAIPYEGDVYLCGEKISNLKPVQMAKLIGVLTQKHQPQFAHSVYEVVSLGRYAYRDSLFGGLNSKDKTSIEEALFLTGVDKLREQSVLTLSGGELQRVFLAQLFAQDPSILVLDEPTNHLDIQYQIAIFDIIKKWSEQKDRAVIAIVHDLNLAYSYGNKAILMDMGKVYYKGEIEDVLSKENLKAVYKVDIANWMKSLLDHWS